jgi:hypothetical protein
MDKEDFKSILQTYADRYVLEKGDVENINDFAKWFAETFERENGAPVSPQPHHKSQVKKPK